MVNRQLPLGMGNLGKAVVEGRLRAEIIDHIVAVALADAAHHAIFRRRVPNALGKNIAVGEVALLCALGSQKPRMGVGGVTRHQIEQNLHLFAVRSLKQPHQIIIGAVAGRHLVVIADVIAAVHKRRVVHGIQPNRVAAETLDIIELLNNTVDVADTVAVGIIEALRIDFIEYCVIEP